MFKQLIFINKLFLIIFFLTLFFYNSSHSKKNTINLNKIIKGMFIGEDLDPKYDTYQDIVLPVTVFAGDPRHTDMRRYAVQKVIYRFIKKQSTKTEISGWFCC